MAGDEGHNPLTSEAVAFRWLLVILAGAATIIAVALLLGSTAGAVWGLVLIAAGIFYVWRLWRGPSSTRSEPTRGGDGRYRVLVLANQTVRSPDLLSAVLEATDERRSEILLVVPALVPSGPKPRSAASDAAAEHARQRMELTLIDLRQNGRSVSGRLDDSEPNRALREALADFKADEIIVSTLPRERSHWLEQGVVERARIEVDIPVRHIVWNDSADASS